MQFREVAVPESADRLLGSSIFLPSGRKLWGKGHRLAPGDVAQMREQGIERVWVVDLEPDEIHEAEVARRVAETLTGGQIALRDEPGGRTSLVAAKSSVIQVDEEAILRLNRCGFAVAATRVPWSIVAAGDRAATVKSRPFAVPKAEFAAWFETQHQNAPAVVLRPLPATPRVSVIYSDPMSANRGAEHLGDAVRQRLTRFNAILTTTAVLEEKNALLGALEAQLRTSPHAILIASTHAPSGPEDPIGQAMLATGAKLECFMAPVEPGALTLLAYRGATPILSAPSCFRNLRANILDILLAPLLAGCVMTPADFARLGPGGLLEF